MPEGRGARLHLREAFECEPGVCGGTAAHAEEQRVTLIFNVNDAFAEKHHRYTRRRNHDVLRHAQILLPAQKRVSCVP